MFQPNRMNEIDHFFMRNNNQVTPKRSYSPRLTPQMQDNQRPPNNMQYFPSNKENFLPNRTSVSPNKMNFARKPMINGPASNGGSNLSPSLLVSPRNKNSYQGIQVNGGYQNNHGGFQQQIGRHEFASKNQNTSTGLLKRLNHGGNEVQFVMSKGVQYCENHGNKVAQFWINIEGQKMKYCSVCASKLASQGFTVLKIVNESQKSVGSSLRKPKSIPSFPQYRGNPFYEEISQFLREMVGVENQHYEMISKFNSLDQHYNNQLQLTTQYYDEVIKILSEMKEQHLQDLNEEKEKFLQIADIQVDYLNQNVEEITYMREDIEPNIPSIVQDIEEDSFKQCVYEYRQKLSMLKHGIQEKQDNLKMVTTYDQQMLSNKVSQFQTAMKQIWKQEPQSNKNSNNVQQYQNQNQKNQPSNRNNKNQGSKLLSEHSDTGFVKNMHDMLPKSSVQQMQGQGQGAFRHLFGDEDEDGEETLPIPSPQFKKI